MTAQFTTQVYPHGCALRVTANAREVIEQVELLWSSYPRLSPLPPVSLRIHITEGSGAIDHATCRIQGRRILFRSSQQDWAVADLTTCSAYGTFTRSSLQNGPAWRYQFLEPLGYCVIAARHFTLLHAAAIAIDNRAILLCGDSGAGKTCLAFAAALKRWSFVSGDAVALHRGTSLARITGRPYEIRFREAAVDLFPNLAQFPAVLRPNKKRDIEFDPRELNIPTTLEADVAAIVFLERCSGAPASIEPLSPQELLQGLSTSICFGNATLRYAQQASLNRLVSLPKYRLHYSGLAPAEQLLWEIAQKAAWSASA